MTPGQPLVRSRSTRLRLNSVAVVLLAATTVAFLIGAISLHLVTGTSAALVGLGVLLAALGAIAALAGFRRLGREDSSGARPFLQLGTLGSALSLFVLFGAGLVAMAADQPGGLLPCLLAMPIVLVLLVIGNGYAESRRT